MSLVPDNELRVAAETVRRADRDSESIVRGLRARYPEDARVHFLLGVLFERTGRYAEALSCLDCAIELNPDHVQMLSAKALVLSMLGHGHQAQQLLADAVERRPENPQLWTNLGIAREKLLDFQGALEAYDRALAITYAQPAARMNRGYVLSRLGRFEQALANNRLLVNEYPDDPDAHYNLAEVLLVLRRGEEALQICRTALHLAPGHAKALIVSGLALSVLGRFEDARQVFKAALASDPVAVRNYVNPFDAERSDNVDRFDPELIYLARAYERFHDCDWPGREDFIEQFLDIVRGRISSGGPIGDPSVAYNALTLPVAASLRLEIARTLSAGFSARSSRKVNPVWQPRESAGRLRVGYLSPDFREHLNAYLLRPLVDLHDRANFEIVCYSSGPADDSEIRDRVRSASDEFVEIIGLDADTVADRIREDGIDILVDVGGFTTFSRPDVLVRQPAPIQVSYLGFPGTLGMPAVQYRITDRIATPSSQRDAWSESLVYLPETFFIYDRFEPLPEFSLSRADYALPESGFVFCSFNNYYKIEPGIFGLWMEILHAVPMSVIWLTGRNPVATANLRREAEARGVAGDRLIFAPFESRDRYRSRFRLADLFLDTATFNAMTTASDALAAGLPVLTLAGSAFPERVAASLLAAAGFHEGIVESVDAYRRKAIGWGISPRLLRDARREKLAHPLKTALFDTEGRVRQLEAAYREMRHRLETGMPPESFDVVAQPAAPEWRSQWH